MKADRGYPIAIITDKNAETVQHGHPWIYADEIISCPSVENGSLIDVTNQKGAYLGTGLLSENSKIRIRLLSRNANDRFDEAFFRRRIKWAIEYRMTVLRGDIHACRLIFGEADWMPGVTVDKYGDILVTQILSYGMEIRKGMIYSLLIELLSELGEKISGIFERNELKIRELEGLEKYKGWYGDIHPENTVTQITENGIRYNVDFENGQKTGFFLDQRFNRREVAYISKGKHVLDCCTHTGSFALNAAAGGAASVTAMDISEEALCTAKQNAVLNGMENKIDFVKADVFDYLPLIECVKPSKYDFIILDPPAFTKSRDTVSDAIRGYTEINTRAMKALPRGGYLATCSCSHFMEEKMFVKMIKNAAEYANVSVRLIKACAQSPDHPELMSVPETKYLKFYLLQIT